MYNTDDHYGVRTVASLLAADEDLHEAANFVLNYKFKRADGNIDRSTNTYGEWVNRDGSARTDVDKFASLVSACMYVFPSSSYNKDDPAAGVIYDGPTIEDLDRLAEEKNVDALKKAARYVLNRLYFTILGDTWLSKAIDHEADFGGFLINENQKGHFSGWGRDFTIVFVNDDWQYKGSKPGDFSVYLYINCPTYTELCDKPFSYMSSGVGYKMRFYLSAYDYEYKHENENFKYLEYDANAVKFETNFANLRADFSRILTMYLNDIVSKAKPIYIIKSEDVDSFNLYDKKEAGVKSDLDYLISMFETGKTKMDGRYRISNKQILGGILYPVRELVEAGKWELRDGDYVIDVPKLSEAKKFVVKEDEEDV